MGVAVGAEGSDVGLVGSLVRLGGSVAVLVGSEVGDGPTVDVGTSVGLVVAVSVAFSLARIRC